jgi:hypothetical protein
MEETNTHRCLDKRQNTSWEDVMNSIRITRRGVLALGLGAGA